jgi:hypothetical protein
MTFPSVRNLLDTHYMEYNDPSEDISSDLRVYGVVVSNAHLYAVVERVVRSAFYCRYLIELQICNT